MDLEKQSIRADSRNSWLNIMIVKMKKLTLLCTRAQQEQTLDKLRDLQVVHVEHVQAPDGADLEKARNHLLYVQRAQEVLAAHPDTEPTGTGPDELADKVWALIHREKELKESIQALEHEHARIAPFGEFDPRAIQKLNEEGLFVKLYELPAQNTPEAPDGVAITEISRGKYDTYVLAVSKNDFTLPAHEVRLPDRSLSRIEHHLEKNKKALEETEAQFQKYAGDKKIADEIVAKAEDAVRYLEVRQGMGTDSAVTYLQGFYPIDREADLVAAAEENGWGYQFEETSDDDMPPTLLRNPKWVNPIKPVFQMIGVLPGYRELDVSAVFLIFLSIFYAFLIGDAGYGFMFVAISLFFKAKYKGNEKAQYIMNLLILMSSCTIVWGMLTGVYFGISFDALPAPLRSLSSGWLIGHGDPEVAKTNVMHVCFTLGAVHLSIAHLWNFIKKINTWEALANIGWLICTWMLYFVVLQMVLDIQPPFSANFLWGGVGIGAGLVFIALLLQKEILGVITLALDIISNFVDIISYVRLYAVGAASFAIANAFNEMAVNALGEKGILIGGLIATLCIFGGHALNIALGAMGILVHGIRLNTLEFSSHAGVQWAGEKFNPFSRKETSTQQGG